MQRPYLLRAMHEWMSDNALTPHIVIDVASCDAALPLEYAKDGKLIINVGYSATQNLYIDNQHASFDARFGGVSRHLDVPIPSIIGIYARETGQGMIFSSEQAPEEIEAADSSAHDAMQEPAKSDTAESRMKPPSGPPQLKIIK